MNAIKIMFVFENCWKKLVSFLWNSVSQLFLVRSTLTLYWIELPAPLAGLLGIKVKELKTTNRRYSWQQLTSFRLGITDLQYVSYPFLSAEKWIMLIRMEYFKFFFCEKEISSDFLIFPLHSYFSIFPSKFQESTVKAA